jgi:cytoskeleton protein RodZ
MGQRLECKKLKRIQGIFQGGKAPIELPGRAMVSVASKLKSEREKRGMALARIASETRINLRHLQSLEEGRYGDLPGGIYNRAFLKAYCESLKLDPTEILELYEREVSPHAEKHSRMGSQTRTGGFSFRINPIAIWSLMLLVSATGLFLSRKRIAEIFSPYFSYSSTPGDHYETLTAPLPDSPQSFNSSVLETPVSPQASLTLNETAAQTALVSDNAGETTFRDDPFPLIRLELAATEKCWILIDRDGAPAVRKLLKPGEVESLGAVEKLFIILGNAGGVHLKINGMPARQLGKTGEVRRLLITEKSIPNLLDETAG